MRIIRRRLKRKTEINVGKKKKKIFLKQIGWQFSGGKKRQTIKHKDLELETIFFVETSEKEQDGQTI